MMIIYFDKITLEMRYKRSNYIFFLQLYNEVYNAIWNAIGKTKNKVIIKQFKSIIMYLEQGVRNKADSV